MPKKIVTAVDSESIAKLVCYPASKHHDGHRYIDIQGLYRDVETPGIRQRICLFAAAQKQPFLPQRTR